MSCSCDGTGYTEAGYLFEPGPCSCDARPFGPPRLERDRPPEPVAAVFTRAEAIRADIDRIYHDAELSVSIDEALRWSRDTLGALVGLAQWTSFLTAGGPLPIVARSVLARCDDLDIAAGELPGLIAQLRRAASAALPAEVPAT